MKISNKCNHYNCRPCDDDAYDQVTTKAVEAILNTLPHLSGLFVDCGAHCGLWSLRMIDYYEKSDLQPWILAIEPEDNGFACLQSNLKVTKSWNKEFRTLFHGAAWVVDHAKLSYSPAGARSWIRPESQSGTHHTWGLTVDSLMRNMPAHTPDVLKVDCEGSEALVLAGAAQTLWSMAEAKRIVVVEYCPDHLERHGSTIAGIHKYMGVAGFKLTNIDEKRLLKQRPASVFNAVYQGIGDEKGEDDGD